MSEVNLIPKKEHHQFTEAECSITFATPFLNEEDAEYFQNVMFITQDDHLMEFRLKNNATAYIYKGREESIFPAPYKVQQNPSDGNSQKVLIKLKDEKKLIVVLEKINNHIQIVPNCIINGYNKYQITINNRLLDKKKIIGFIVF